MLLLLVLREVKDREAEGFPNSFMALHTVHRAPLMRRLALALRFRDRWLDLQQPAARYCRCLKCKPYAQW